MDKTEAGRLLSSLRPVRQKTCPVCGKVFEGVGRRQYCSRACKQHAYYRNKNPGAVQRGAQQRESEAPADQPSTPADRP